MQSNSAVFGIIKKIFSFIYFLVLLCLVLFSVAAVVLLFKNKGSDEPLKIAGFSSYIVQTNSMKPHFSAGAFIVVKEVSPNTLKVEDVIAYKLTTEPGSERITHRVKEIIDVGDKKEFRTQGDNNNTMDRNNITEDRLIGKVVFFVDHVGTQFANMSTPYFISAMVFLIMLLLILPYFS